MRILATVVALVLVVGLVSCHPDPIVNQQIIQAKVVGRHDYKPEDGSRKYYLEFIWRDEKFDVQVSEELQDLAKDGETLSLIRSLTKRGETKYELPE